MTSPDNRTSRSILVELAQYLNLAGVRAYLEHISSHFVGIESSVCLPSSPISLVVRNHHIGTTSREIFGGHCRMDKPMHDLLQRTVGSSNSLNGLGSLNRLDPIREDDDAFAMTDPRVFNTSWFSSPQPERQTASIVPIEPPPAERRRPHGPRSLSGSGPENSIQDYTDLNYTTEDFDDHTECFDQFYNGLTKYTTRHTKDRRLAIGTLDEVQDDTFATFVEEYSHLFDRFLRKKELRQANRRSARERKKAEGWSIRVSSKGYASRTLSA